jgi:hypothetical protein
MYLIAYDAVYEYADETSSTFHEYQLTYQSVRDDDEKLKHSKLATQKQPGKNGTK